MTDKTDYRDLLVRYIAHVRRLERGSDLLTDAHAAPFSFSEIAEMRRLAGSSPVNPSQLLPEKTGGDPDRRDWFAKALEGLPRS
jgi:hypothetical protein